MTKEQIIIEKHLKGKDAGWYNLLSLHPNGFMIVWGRGNRTYTKYLKYET